MPADNQITCTPERLAQCGLQDAVQAVKNLELLRAKLGAEGYAVILPGLLASLALAADSDMALNNCERYVSALGDVPSFRSICRTRPDVLDSLVTIFGASRFLSTFLVTIADESLPFLSDPGFLAKQSDRQRLSERLASLTRGGTDDKKFFPRFGLFCKQEVVRVRAGGPLRQGGIPGNGGGVIRRREKEPEGDGLPPGHARIASPYDTDARWGVKRDTFWLGYKLHVTETCDDEPRCGCPGEGGAGRRGHDKDCAAPAFPNLITHVATTGATVTDNQMTSVIHDELAGKTLAPGRHYLDSGYLSAALLVSEAARHGIALIGPLLADTPAQARAGNGYARADFAVDYGSKTVTCPQGRTAASWTPCTQHGKDAIVATFSASDCGPCPARSLCTTSGKNRRQLTVPPRDLAQAQAAARAAENTIPFQADYARRAGVEGTMHQATSHGARRTRYRGLPKTSLDHVYMACALNLLRLHAYWTGTPLDRRRTSHLARLGLGLAA